MASESPPEASRTLVCSVLFLDIAAYSQHGVSDQIRLKERFNQVLAHSLADLETRDRVVIDTGDGAAIAFLGDPEAALFAALAIFDNVGELAVRMGINLGPVYLARDINGQQNVIGDGINVAQRVMSFAQKGELLVSRSFYDVVLLLSGDYATMFQSGGARGPPRGGGAGEAALAASPGAGLGRGAASGECFGRRQPFPRIGDQPRKRRGGARAPARAGQQVDCSTGADRQHLDGDGRQPEARGPRDGGKARHEEHRDRTDA
jgi:hypothetical protein